MPMSKNKAITGVVISKEIKEQLEHMAKEDRRSLSNYISIILEDYVKHKSMQEKNLESQK